MPTTTELFRDYADQYTLPNLWQKYRDFDIPSYIQRVGETQAAEFIDSQIEEMNENPEEIKKWIWDPSSFGNLAHFALHAPKEEHRNKCLSIFNLARNICLQTPREPAKTHWRSFLEDGSI